jgi:hypothetical protein
MALRLAANEGSVFASTAGWAESCSTAAELTAMHAATVIPPAGPSGMMIR